MEELFRCKATQQEVTPSLCRKIRNKIHYSECKTCELSKPTPLPKVEIKDIPQAKVKIKPTEEKKKDKDKFDEKYEKRLLELWVRYLRHSEKYRLYCCLLYTSPSPRD